MIFLGSVLSIALIGGLVTTFLPQDNSTNYVSNHSMGKVHAVTPSHSAIEPSFKDSAPSPELTNPNYQKLPENLRWEADWLTTLKTKPLKNETDPSIRVCRFNASTDNGIVASCLNAFIHLSINNETDNPFFKKLVETLRQEQKPVTDNSAPTNPHDIIQSIFNELGDDVILQGVVDNEKSAIKDCLLTGGNTPLEFVTTLYKVCGLEKNDKFARSVTNKQTGTKKYSPPCLQLKPDQNFEYFSGDRRFQPDTSLKNYLLWDGFSKEDFKRYAHSAYYWDESISVIVPKKYISVSMDKLLPLVNCKLVADLDDHIWDFVVPNIEGYYHLKSLVCCNMTKDEILDGKVHGVSKSNRNFSCVLNNSDLGRFIVLDPSNPKIIQKHQRKNYPDGTREEDRRFDDSDWIENIIKIDDDNYRIPIMAFYERGN